MMRARVLIHVGKQKHEISGEPDGRQNVTHDVPRFYFHLFNDATCMDEEGMELASPPAAMEKATMLARSMAAESVRDGHLILSHRIDVADASGGRVGTVRFGDVVQVKA